MSRRSLKPWPNAADAYPLPQCAIDLVGVDSPNAMFGRSGSSSDPTPTAPLDLQPGRQLGHT